MIPDNQTNTVYLAEDWPTKFNSIYEELYKKLKSWNVNVKHLDQTRDIWARDYMPIQLSREEFVEYRYDPDYLMDPYGRQVKTFTGMVCDSIGIKTDKLDLFLDGGNIIKSDDCLIMTDKIFLENEDFVEKKGQEALKELLKQSFGVKKLAVIPWDEINEEYGHADGMIRFIDNKKVLVHGFYWSKYYSEDFRERLFGPLKKVGLEIVRFETTNEALNYNWAYLNFLQTKDIIVVPGVGYKSDEKAIEEISMHFPKYASDKRIKSIDLSKIIMDEEDGGGALNCLTWTIKA